ncbi:ornithine--oxo-acid transaminase [bacterium]|nr:ornithine--oxo-acid transaminase [bacterium]
MSKTQELLKVVDHYGAHNYLPLPVVLNRAEGSRVWDVEGKSYLDFLSCYSALNFGHQNPRLTKALIQQAGKLALCSRAFHSEELCLFSKELADFVGLDQVLPMNSGAEAVETAVKIARKWGYVKRKVSGEANIIVFENNFHGRTITIVSFSTEPDYKAGFGPFTPGFKSVPFNSVADLEKAIDANTVGVLVEPVQAEAGILIPSKGFLKQVRELCTRKNVLLLMDEIQTGLGRTGRDFCFQHEGAKPDLLILGKSLGGGLLPISAVVGRKDVMDVIQPGQHGSTFGGNPLACAVAREALALLKDSGLSARSERLGAQAVEMLQAAKLPRVKEVRGLGALIGVELDTSSGGARKYCEKIAQEGVLCKETHTYVIRIAPPLTIEETDLRSGVETIIRVIRSFG